MFLKILLDYLMIAFRHIIGIHTKFQIDEPLFVKFAGLGVYYLLVSASIHYVSV